MKKLVLLVVMVMLAAFCLAGCGGDDVSSDDTTTTTAGGNQLIIGISSVPTSLDEQQISDYNSDRVASEIYDTLLRFSDTGTDVEPNLATDWDISEDGLTYTLTLRDDVKFHDGTDFNAEAVVFNYERFVSGDPVFAYADPIFGSVTSPEEDRIVKSAEAVDDTTVVFHLYQPFAPFLAHLAMTQFSIVSPTAADGVDVQDFGRSPVGTGPYKFGSWTGETEVVLEKNDDYWGNTPNVDRLIYRFITDDNTRLNELEAGSIDIAVDPLPDSIAGFEANSGFQILQEPGLHTWYLSLNTQVAPFDNADIRHAFYYAIDREAIVDNILLGTGVLAENFLPPATPGYTSDVPKYEYSPEKAKELLEKAGATDLTVDFWVPEGGSGMQSPDAMATAIQGDLANVGVTLNIKKLEWGAYLDQMFGDFPPEDQEMLLGQMSWISDNGDPDNFLFFLCSNTQWPPNYNSAYYSNAEFEKLITEARFNPNWDERKPLYEEAQKILMGDLPYLPIDHEIITAIGRDGIDGFVIHPRGFFRTGNVTMP
ncbi:MAG: ABC transporter substrate-binding protein [Actinomycetia bacterium]|nr:ABC transporter substrate-binding protein [Actinomycetes bacterium]